MRNIKVRLAKPEEAEQMLQWMQPHIEDFERVKYPTTRLVCAENGRPIQYALIHAVAVLETLGPDPKANAFDLALSLREIVSDLKEACSKAGIKEVIAMTGPGDEKLERLAERNGWTKVPFNVWRLRLE